MNGLVKSAHRVIQGCVKSSSLTSALVSRTQAPVKRDFTRGIWHMSSRSLDGPAASMGLLHNHSNTCSCGCGLKALHTKDQEDEEKTLGARSKPLGERELVEFLTEEIVAERKAQKVKTLPKELEGFAVKEDGAEVTLTKKLNDESIVITFNVNHTVDSEDFGEGEQQQQPEKQEFSEMRSRPQFEVDLVRGDTTLSFTCSFIQEPSVSEEYNDVFGIDEVTLYKGEWNDKVYAVAGDVLDGYLYDLLMNLLEEKGVSNDFAQKLSDYSTAFEHAAYINLLEAVSKFTIEK